jgi:hypothetical protein
MARSVPVVSRQIRAHEIAHDAEEWNNLANFMRVAWTENNPEEREGVVKGLFEFLLDSHIVTEEVSEEEVLAHIGEDEPLQRVIVRP